MVESEDYEEYMANLRAIGCPESTLRGIILAEVRELFTRKRAALAPPSFWTAGKVRSAAERKLEERERALEDQLSALTQHLLGEEFTDEPTGSDDDLVGHAILRFILGPVPEKSIDEVFRAMVSFSEASGRIRYRAVKLEREEAELRALGRKVQERVQQALTSAQYDETCDRMAALRLVDHEPATLQSFELRQIARFYRQAFGDWTDSPLTFFGRNDEDAESRWRFATLVKGYLGDQRYIEYKSQTDASFRQLLEVAEGLQLPRAHALQVFELRALADIESERIASADELADSECERQARELQEALSVGATQILGERAYQAYLANGGEWLTNSIP
jgi:hypothetical protein